jgi:hypothetical protein
LGGFGGGAGGLGSQSLIAGGGGGGAGMGGAIFNMQGTVTVTNSTLASNSATGGNGGGGNGSTPATGGEGLGGAIFNLNGQLTVASSTFAQNAAYADGGAVYNLAYDAATARSASAKLSDSILFGSSDGAGKLRSDLLADQPADVTASGGGGSNQGITSTDAGGHDIVGQVATAGLTSVSGSPASADPRLGPLAFNGGPGMATMALSAGSPALGQGSGCPATDERGVARPIGLCDLGAYQLSAPASPPPLVALAGLRVFPASFSIAGRRIGGRCVKASRSDRRRRRCTLPIALQITYTLSGPGIVALTIAREDPGRVVAGRCVTSTRANRRRKHCTRVVRVPGAIMVASQAGLNRFAFDGRIGGRRLGAGMFEVTAALAGNRHGGRSQTAAFRLVR